MKFHKLHGTGNDFIVVNNWHKEYSDWKPAFIKQICTAHTGIGADGFLAIERSDRADFRMRFFNSDGYEAEMCVNGSRCICYLAHHEALVGEKFSFEAMDGIHSAQILGEYQVRVQVLWQNSNELRTFPAEISLPANIRYKQFLNTGVPHIVLDCDDVDQVDVRGLGEQLRFHKYYQPQGTNVNFAQLRDGLLRIRTYERGVDAETLSCGTGATACAITYAGQMAGEEQRIVVETRGGKLFVYIDKKNRDIYLEGAVTHVFQGVYI